LNLITQPQFYLGLYKRVRAIERQSAEQLL
jgi:hypothetical protein